MTAIVLLAVLALLLVLQSRLFSRFGLSRIEYERHFTVSHVYEGERAELVEVICNRKLLPVPWLRIESRMPESFDFHTKEELEIHGQRYHKSVFMLMPYSRVTRTHPVVFQKRGVYSLDEIAVTCGDLFGMSMNTRAYQTKARMAVYPCPEDDDGGQWLSSRQQGELVVRRWIAPDPFLINGIRDYRAGDRVRDVHWAAFAKSGRLQVKTHDYTAEPRLLVLVNCQRSQTQWGDLMPYEQAFIERAIRITAALCLRALDVGLACGFGANMPMNDGEECAYMPPVRNAERQEELLYALASLRVKRALSFPTFLDSLGAMEGMDILILSAYESELLDARIHTLRMMGNTVRLVNIGEGAA